MDLFHVHCTSGTKSCITSHIIVGVIVQMRIRNREEEIIQRNIKQMRPRMKPYNFGDCFTRAEIIFDIYSSLPAVIVFC